MKFKVIFYALCFLFVNENLYSAVLKDPRLRDEDISATIVTVDYFTRPDGLYEYAYSIESPLGNKGIINSMSMDLTCSGNFPPVTLPYADGMPGYSDIAASFGRAAHTPTAIHADYGSAFSYGISTKGVADWGIYMKPGNSVSGLRLISAVEPGMRTYSIEPWMDNDESWDYPEAKTPDIPWIQDFTITGMIAGPGCPGVTQPPELVTLYPGSRSHKEPEHINKLLSYRIPLKDRFHVEAGTTETTLHIYYADEIDAESFKVKPGWMKQYFNPVAGTNERVYLPLKKKRNKIKLSVRSIEGEHKDKKEGDDSEDEGHEEDEDKDDDEKKDRKDKKSSYSNKDTDKFEFRIDEPRVTSEGIE